MMGDELDGWKGPLEPSRTQTDLYVLADSSRVPINQQIPHRKIGRHSSRRRSSRTAKVRNRRARENTGDFLWVSVGVPTKGDAVDVTELKTIRSKTPSRSAGWKHPVAIFQPCKAFFLCERDESSISHQTR